MPQMFVFTAGNPEARAHLADSITESIDLDAVGAHVAGDEKTRLEKLVAKHGGLYAWGAEPGRRNVPTWESMEPGDTVLCVYDNTYHYAAQIVGKLHHEAFAEAVWGRNESSGNTWEYVYFLDEPRLLGAGIPDADPYLNNGYRGFTRISDEKVATIERDFGSIQQFVAKKLLAADQVDDFLPIMRRYLEEGVVFQSEIKGQRYRVTAVNDDRARVARLDASRMSSAGWLTTDDG